MFERKLLFDTFLANGTSQPYAVANPMGGCFRLLDFIAPPPLNIYHSNNYFGSTCSSAISDAASAVEKLDFEPLPACIEY